jgi:hypothetical protein
VRFAGRILWAAVSLAAAFAMGVIAQNRGEPVNSIWLVIAAACTYLVGYRFYAAFIAARAMALDDRRATPAERLRDGHDFEPTNKWIVFGHHFAAIAGPGPLVGPTLAAQFGYLPGAIWIVIGAVLGGAVQDFVVLFCPLRRDGKSLGQMAREEIGKVGGFISLVTVLLIMIILLAVIGLVVVNALKDSPWGVFTIASTMPIALIMGIYLRYLRPGKVLECSALGFVLLMGGIFGGGGAFDDDRALVHLWRSGACNRAHRLRVSLERPAGLAVAGPARLPVDLRKARRHRFTRCGHNISASRIASSAVHAFRRWNWAHFRGQDFSIRVHHHRLRRRIRISFPDLLGHYAQDAD